MTVLGGFLGSGKINDIGMVVGRGPNPPDPPIRGGGVTEALFSGELGSVHRVQIHHAFVNADDVRELRVDVV